MPDYCKDCAGTGIIKVQRAEMYCPACLRTGEHIPPMLSRAPERPRPARKSRTEERDVDIRGGELYD